MKLVKASENVEALKNLFSLYVYDLANDDPWLGTMINENGAYEPPHGIESMLEETDVYLIYEDNKAIGFVNFLEGKEADYCVQEIFVIKAYRRKGIATEIFNDYLKDKTGTFMVHILKKSEIANGFFNAYCKNANLTYRTEERDAVANNYFIEL